MAEKKKPTGTPDGNLGAALERMLVLTRVAHSRRLEVNRKSNNAGYTCKPTPTSPKMMMLTCIAENLCRQWQAENFELVQWELNQVPRKDLAILCALMTEITQPLRRRELWNWLEGHLSNETPVCEAPAAETLVA